MSGLVVVFGGLAAAAVWLRVGQYGWTPERVSAAAVAMAVLGYGVVYGLALLRGAEWRAGVRAGNWTMALSIIAGGIFWLNPWVTAESISVQSQLARFDPEVEAEKAPLWEMGHEWGRFGTSAIGGLKDDAGPVLGARLAALEAAQSRYEFNQSALTTPDARAHLAELIPVLPEGQVLDEKALERLAYSRTAEQWEEDCARRTPQGNPACLVIVADVSAATEGDEIVAISGQLLAVYHPRFGETPRASFSESRWSLPEGMTPEAAIDAFWSEGVVLVPSGDQVFSLGGQRLEPRWTN
jgi:hypothetical protein